MKISVIAIILVICVLLYLLLDSAEPFWDGYSPVPYMGQPIQSYGRYAYEAADDDPHGIVDPYAMPIN
jgi:hypothetical protein